MISFSPNIATFLEGHIDVFNKLARLLKTGETTSWLNLAAVQELILKILSS